MSGVRVKFLGVNDDVTTCECCGRSGLKKTVVLDIGDGNLVHYGTQCAANKLRFGHQYGAKSSVGRLMRNFSWRGDSVFLAAE